MLRRTIVRLLSVVIVSAAAATAHGQWLPGADAADSAAISHSGNVGIGSTNSPTTKLTIQPAAYTSATDGIKFVSADNSVHSIVQPVKVPAGGMNLFLGSNAYISTAAGGNVLRFDTGTASAWVNVRSTDGTIRFATSTTGANPTERMQIDSSGNVGIGGIAPTTRLTIQPAAYTSATDGIKFVSADNAIHSIVQSIKVPAGGMNLFLGSNAYVPTNPNGNVLRFDAGTASAWVNVRSTDGTIRFATSAVDTDPTERMQIDSSGHVGIGTSANSSDALVVNGSIHGTSVIGATYQDFAEWVPASEEMAPGTVVVLNRRKSNEVMPSRQPYDTSVAGVVSGNPGVLLGEPSESKVKIATTGRVRVRVNAEDGAIGIGDLLVTSGRPGMAMKSQPVVISGRSFHQPGTLIGKALEPMDRSEGEILVLLSLQ